MTEFYRFFDAALNPDGVTYDRIYRADDFAEYFRTLLTDGIFNGGTNLKVSSDGQSMRVNITDGFAWIRGYMYKIVDGEALAHTTADQTYNRIDRVIIRLDIDARLVKAMILTGEKSASPVAPSLVRTDKTWDISLARVLIPAKSTSVNPANITDERLDANVCGLVNSLITADTTSIHDQFQNWYDDRTTTYEAQWAQFVTDWNNFYGPTVTEWDAWFAQTKADLNNAVVFDFDNLSRVEGMTRKTLFNTPSAGNITEEIRNTIDNTLFATRQTLFDNPTNGQIKNIITCTSLNVNVEIVTTFNGDGTISEVVS